MVEGTLARNEARRRMAGALRPALAGLLRFGFDATVLPFTFFAIAGHFGREAWLFDMVTFFRPHIAAMAVLLLLLAIATGSRPRMVVGAIVFVAALVPLVVPNAPAAMPAAQSDFRVMTANVMGAQNLDFDRFRSLVAEQSPDLLVAEEVQPAWRATVASLAGLPYSAGPEFTGGDSTTMVASRYPIRSSQILWRRHDPLREGEGAIPMRIEVDRPGRRPLVVLAIHPPTPRSFDEWHARDTYLLEIAWQAQRDARTAEVIVIGDWNTPYWSPFYTRALQQADLRATEGAWPAPTRIFREFGAPDFLGSPIDLVAVSPSIGLVRRTVGRAFGSDHLPVIVDLAVP